LKAQGVPKSEMPSSIRGGLFPWAETSGLQLENHAVLITVKTSEDVDTDFVHLMFPHHQAAIDMAKTELAYGGEIRKCAGWRRKSSLINSQRLI